MIGLLGAGLATGCATVEFWRPSEKTYLPVPGETYVTSVDTIERFLRESGQESLARLSH